MALNNLGLGLTFLAKDLAGSVVQGLSSKFQQLKESAHKAGESMHELGEGMEKAGTAMAALGVAGLVFFGLAAAKAEEMEKALRLVATRTTEAVFPMEEMEGLASDLAVHFGNLPIDQAKAMFAAVGAGATSAAQAEQLLTAANQLAKASNSELGSSLEVVASLLKVYGLGFEHAEDAADALFIASRNSNTSVGELGAMLEHLGPMAARAGIGMEELLATISALGNAGLKGRVAMSGMRAILESFVAPSKEAKAEALRLGIAFNEAALKSKGLPEILREITTSGKFNAQTLEKMFGSMEAGTAVLALMKNGGAGLTAALNEIAKGEGAAGAAAEKLVTPGQRLTALKEKAMLLIGQAVLPLVEALQRLGVVILTVFNAIPKPIITAGVLLGVVSSVLLLVAGSAVATAGAFMAMEAALWPVLAGLAIGVVVAGAFAAALLLIGGPVGLALFGLYEAFEHNLGGIRETLTALWEKVKLVYEGITQLFESGGFSGAVRKELDKASNAGLKQFAIEVFMWGMRLRQFFVAAGEGLEAGIQRLKPVFQALSAAFHELDAALGQLFGGENNPIQNAHKWDTFAGAGERVGAMLSGLVAAAAKVITWVVEMTTAVATHLHEHQAIFTRIGDAFTAIVRHVGEIAEALGSFNASMGAGKGALDYFGSAVASFIAGDARLLVWVLEAIARGAAVVASALGAAARVWNVWRNTATSAIQEVIRPLQALAALIDRVAAKLGMVTGLSGRLGALTGALPGGRQQVGAEGGPGRVAGAEGPGRGAGGLPGSGAPPVRGGPVVAAVATSLGTMGGGGAGIGAEVSAAVQHGLASAPAPNVNAPVAVYLDGEKIAEAMARRQGSKGARSFEPAPTPG